MRNPFRLLRSAGALKGRDDTPRPAHFVEDYEHHVDMLMRNHPLDEAMSLAVGGRYDEVGQIQADLIASLGLTDGMSLVDLGCGSGRTAKHLGRRFPSLKYTGIDVVQRLLDYAGRQSPEHFRFIRHTEVTVPLPDTSADMVVAFSLFTHLQHEETYCYLQEIHRILRPRGTLVFSFLQFGRPQHWAPFDLAVSVRKQKARYHHTAFIEENVIEVWAGHLGFTVEQIMREHPMGQTIAVLRKP